MLKVLEQVQCHMVTTPLPPSKNLALRKMGEMLKSSERAKGAVTVGGDKRSGGTVVLPPEDAEMLIFFWGVFLVV